jgi:hypothetical protein
VEEAGPAASPPDADFLPDGVGWDLALNGMTLHLASGESVDPEAFAAWSTSEEGRRFAIVSSQAWGDASVAAGTDRPAAAAAANRTTAFYTGTEVPAAGS